MCFKLFYFLVLILSITIYVSAQVHMEEDDDGILILNSEKFDQANQKYQYLLINFYSSFNDPKSDKFVGHFLKAWEEVRNDEPAPVFAKLDVGYDQKKYKELGFTHSPVVVLCVFSKCSTYAGKLEYKSIVKYIRKKTLSPTINLKSIKELDKFIKQNNNFFVYFADKNAIIEAGGQLPETLKIYKDVANRDDLLDYVYIDDPAAIKEFNTKINSAVIFRKNQEPLAITNFTLDTFKQFVVAHAFPKVFNYSEDVGDIIFSRGIPFMLYIRDDKIPKHSEKDVILKQLVDKFDNHLKLIFSNLNTEEEKQLASNWQITNKAEIPFLMILDPRKGDSKHYFYEDSEISADKVFHWFEKWRNGDLRQSLMTQPIPTEDQSKKLVKRIVSKNFGEKVINTTRDSVVLFYSSDNIKTQQNVLDYFNKFAEEITKKNKNVDFFIIDSYYNNVEEAFEAGEGIKFYIWLAKDKTKKIEFLSYSLKEEDVRDFLKVHLPEHAEDDMKIEI